MAESLISPGELLRHSPAVAYPSLKRTDKDIFYSFNNLSGYMFSVRRGITNAKISEGYKAYLNSLLQYKTNPAAVKKVFNENKKDINVAEVTKYFGEILGPIHVATGGEKIIFPQRANYELFDFFIEDARNVHGFSSKQMGGSSNTLAPYLILENMAKIKGTKITNAKEKHTLEVLKLLDASGVLDGPLNTLNYLISNNIIPPTANQQAVRHLKSVNFSALKSGNTVTDKHMQMFMHNYVLPRLKGSAEDPMTDQKKNDYINGKIPYTKVNAAYAAIMYITDASKSGLLSPTGLVKNALPNLNILKMGLTNDGLPTFILNSIYSAEKYDFRSKARWTKVKDKLGIQL